MRLHPLIAALLALGLIAPLAACDAPAPSRGHTVRATGDTTKIGPPKAFSPGALPPDTVGHLELIPATAGLDRVNDLVLDPGKSKLPSDAHVAAMVQQGYAIMRDTRRNASAYAGSDLSCANCHLNAGQKTAAWPLVGVAALFPQYRARSGRLITLEDRIRDCFMRSLNGKAPPFDSKELLAVSAYITWISTGNAMGREPSWHGKNEIAKENQLSIDKLDVAAGKLAFERNCIACHGADGQGVNLGAVKPGPLWGPRSWNDGAGAARVYTLAGFIRYAMPLTAPGSLNDVDAQNIAAYIESHERPHFAHQSVDYPDGKVPVDAVYYTSRYVTNPLLKAKGTR